MTDRAHSDEKTPALEADDVRLLLAATRRDKKPTGDGLRRVSPGFYVDAIGVEYFYLTGLYHLITKRLLEQELVNTAPLVVDIFDELRRALHDLHCAELLD